MEAGRTTITTLSCKRLQEALTQIVWLNLVGDMNGVTKPTDLEYYTNIFATIHDLIQEWYLSIRNKPSHFLSIWIYLL